MVGVGTSPVAHCRRMAALPGTGSPRRSSCTKAVPAERSHDDDHGVALVDATYDTEAEVADMAIRFAQDQGVLPYAVHYDSGSRLV